MALITVLLILTTTSLLRNVKLQEPEWHFTGINIARDKETNQGPHTYRSTKCIKDMDMVSGNAVDNNTNGDFCKGHCTTSYGDNGAYWTVNLGRNYTLNGIRIYNMNNALLWYRNKALKIIGYPSNTTLHDEAKANPHLHNNRTMNVPLSSNATFNNVTIEIPGNGEPVYLSLCEVEVYSVTVFNCSIIPNPSGRSWNIKGGTGYTDTANGVVSSGSVIEFTCVENYKLNGATSLLCTSSGSYDQNAPTCAEIRCNAPPGITNGTYTQQLNGTYPVRSALTWNCETGYRSEQSKERVCTNTAEWSGEQPTCSWITCPFPGPITNGELKRSDDTTIHSGPISNRVSLSVSCDEGYRPNNQTITCNLDGQWNAIPKCEHVTCESLGLLTGGYYSYNSGAINNQVYIYGTIAIPVCKETLYKDGDSTEKGLTCGQYGEWTGGKSGCAAEPVAKCTSSHSLVPTAVGVPSAFVVGCAAGIALMYILFRRKESKSRSEHPPSTNGIYETPNRDMIDEGHVYLEVNEIPDI